MVALSRQIVLRAVAKATSASSVDSSLTPDREARRLIDVNLRDKAKEISLRLKTNAKWMKKFLHGPK